MGGTMCAVSRTVPVPQHMLFESRRPGRRSAAAMAVLLACSLACVPGSVSAARVAQAEPAWQLTLRVTGGFAGRDRELALSSVGAVSVTDRRSSQQASGQLPAGKLQALVPLVRAARTPAPAASYSGEGSGRRCADCQQYTLTITRTIAGDAGAVEREIAVNVNDVTMEASGLAELIRALSQLQNRVFAGTVVDVR